ncbi:hypothetical protein [Trueperella bernardiae]
MGVLDRYPSGICREVSLMTPKEVFFFPDDVVVDTHVFFLDDE